MYTNQSKYEEDCKKLEMFEKVIDIVFSDKYPEYKETELCELLEAYKRDK
jgi:hypothetical protein